MDTEPITETEYFSYLKERGLRGFCRKMKKMHSDTAPQ